MSTFNRKLFLTEVLFLICVEGQVLSASLTISFLRTNYLEQIITLSNSLLNKVRETDVTKLVQLYKNLPLEWKSSTWCCWIKLRSKLQKMIGRNRSTKMFEPSICWVLYSILKRSENHSTKCSVDRYLNSFETSLEKVSWYL